MTRRDFFRRVAATAVASQLPVTLPGPAGPIGYRVYGQTPTGYLELGCLPPSLVDVPDDRMFFYGPRGPEWIAAYTEAARELDAVSGLFDLPR